MTMILRLDSDFIQSTCTPEFSFDESALFQGDKVNLYFSNANLNLFKYHYKDMFRRAFRNISTILDCVGCEKCKLHAKVPHIINFFRFYQTSFWMLWFEIEFHGLGTALKILFSNSALTADNVLLLLFRFVAWKLIHTFTVCLLRLTF